MDHGVVSGLCRYLFCDILVVHLVTSHSNHAHVLIKLDMDHDARPWPRGAKMKRHFNLKDFGWIWISVQGNG